MSCALRKTLLSPSAAATALRWRVGRAPLGVPARVASSVITVSSDRLDGQSVLVVVVAVHGVAMPVVDVVDMVAVLHRRVPAVVTVLVLVLLGYDVVRHLVA